MATSLLMLPIQLRPARSKRTDCAAALRAVRTTAATAKKRTIPFIERHERDCECRRIITTLVHSVRRLNRTDRVCSGSNASRRIDAVPAVAACPLYSDSDRIDCSPRTDATYHEPTYTAQQTWKGSNFPIRGNHFRPQALGQALTPGGAA